ETPLMTGRDMANISEVPSAGICIPITKYCRNARQHERVHLFAGNKPIAIRAGKAHSQLMPHHQVAAERFS
ncbi:MULTISPECIES: hypothetical protein, partial [unclassified Afipia]|uniref:hypothetical protein n=1 Tax=unclassified Afipia TaxID=2642050 RepID=UPI000550A95B